MRIHLSEASPAAINHFTAQSLGLAHSTEAAPDYAGDPQLAAPIIEQLQARHLVLQEDEDRHTWIATLDNPPRVFHGQTAHIAALRCHLAVTCGDFLDLPETLIPAQLDYRNLWSTAARCGE